jgi:hypothetical protein
VSITDYPDYQTPQAHADTISNTGVPLLTRPDNLLNFTGTVGSGAAVVPLSLGIVSKIGYEIFLRFYAPGTNQSIITVQMQWSDSVSGQVVTTEEWDFYAGSGLITNAHIIRGAGPTKGDRLTVQVNQNASTVTASFTIIIAQNSRIYARDDWRTQSIGPVTGITGTNGFDAQNNIVASMDSLAVAAGGNVIALLPLFCGRVVISCTTTSAGADYTFFIRCDTGSFGSLADDQVVRGKTDANGNLVIVGAALPRAQCTVQQVNNNAAAKDLLTFITAAEY